MIRVQISKLKITLTGTPKPLPDVETLQFGVVSCHNYLLIDISSICLYRIPCDRHVLL